MGCEEGEAEGSSHPYVNLWVSGSSCVPGPVLPDISLPPVLLYPVNFGTDRVSLWANFRASLVWLAVNVNISCLTDSKEIQALLRGRRDPNHLRFPTNAVLLPRHSIGREGTMRFHVGRMTVTCRVVLTSCKPEYQLIKKRETILWYKFQERHPPQPNLCVVLHVVD